ncbi:MAG: tetratricopeptide repeat protein [Proteobacteria bacterium]|nr:tetratricopeptide repeat protein [Pseudomonadota bacterium]
MQLIRLAIIFFVTFATFTGFANEENLSDAEDNFNQGQVFYENGEFEAAVNEFSEAISQSPGDSRYHHWLAKTYGEIAETSGWLKAMRLAGKSKDSLKRAVELDPENIRALTDLMKYYQEAPMFLGGSNKKAKEISIRLEELEKKNTHSFDKHHVITVERNS